MDWSWILAGENPLWMVVLSVIGMYGALILFTRLAGLRSFSKISSFDFAITVAFGSILGAAILTDDPPLRRAVLALGLLYGVQFVVSRLRVHTSITSNVVDNTPILVMDGPEILDENLSKAGITKDDLRAKLREANVLRWEEIRAVVVESTGDISVLHGTPDGPALDPTLLSGIRGTDE